MRDSLKAEIQDMIADAINEIPRAVQEKLTIAHGKKVSLSDAVQAILERLSLELVIEPGTPAIPATPDKLVARKVVAK